MAPTVAAAATSVSASAINTLACTMPGSAVAGSLLILTYEQSNSASPTTPSGWTRFGTHDVNGAGNISCGAFYKVSSGSESTLSLAKGTTKPTAVTILRITLGTFNTSTPLESWTTAMETASDATPPIPLATSSQANSLAVTFAGIRSTGATGSGLTAPTGWTSQGSAFAENDTVGIAHGCATKAIGAATMSAADWTSPFTNSGPTGSFIIKPPSGGATLAVTMPDVSVFGYETFTLAAAASGGTAPYSYAFSQTGGTSVTLSGSGASRTGTGTVIQAGETLTYHVIVTDNVAATAADDADVTVAPWSEWYRSGGAWVKQRDWVRQSGAWA